MSNEAFFEESSEQSKVKAKIVADYFWAWANVMLATLRGDKRIGYLDLFAGPGRYKDGTKSTPLLVLEKAIQDPVMRANLVTQFNDVNGDSSDTLQQEINALPGIDSLKYRPRVSNEEVGSKVIELFEAQKTIPVLFFVDPWGYKGLSLGLINSVLRNWGCDCVFFFNYNRINMGLSNPLVEEHMNVLFGMERANELRASLAQLNPDEREIAIIEALVEALKGLGAKYVLPFTFKNEAGKRTSHHLVFATKHPLGYGIMKEIMAKQSTEADQGVPSFAYSPASNKYPLLFELTRPLDDLREMLLTTFAGQSLTTKEIYERHNVDKPYILKNYKTVLQQMESAGEIKVVAPSNKKRRQGTFADSLVVTFPNDARQQ